MIFCAPTGDLTWLPANSPSSRKSALETAIWEGYVKPMFANLEVYNYQKDKNTGVLHQAKELAIGGASHLFKNSNTHQVASQIDLKGKLTSPDISTWQAISQVLHNAFIEAILPGFDPSVRPKAATDAH
jgi:hypothetical protein